MLIFPNTEDIEATCKICNNKFIGPNCTICGLKIGQDPNSHACGYMNLKVEDILGKTEEIINTRPSQSIDNSANKDIEKTKEKVKKTIDTKPKQTIKKNEFSDFKMRGYKLKIENDKIKSIKFHFIGNNDKKHAFEIDIKSYFINKKEDININGGVNNKHINIEELRLGSIRKGRGGDKSINYYNYLGLNFHSVRDFIKKYIFNYYNS